MGGSCRSSVLSRSSRIMNELTSESISNIISSSSSISSNSSKRNKERKYE